MFTVYFNQNPDAELDDSRTCVFIDYITHDKLARAIASRLEEEGFVAKTWVVKF